MRKKINLIFASLVVVFGLSAITFAQNKHPFKVNQRQQTQQKRIYKGISSGEMTRREAVRAGKQQYRINRTESRYRRSGSGLSFRERVDLAKRQNRASRYIYKQKHDKQDYPRP